ncbi:hypothetical protein FKM82_025784, partial [Ascaphus truei]
MCRPATCQLLIEKGADINTRDKLNKTALMVGCEFGCRDAVDVLLRSGADVGLVDSLGHDCAYYARIGDNLEILSMIRIAMENAPRGDAASRTPQHPPPRLCPNYISPCSSPRARLSLRLLLSTCTAVSPSAPLHVHGCLSVCSSPRARLSLRLLLSTCTGVSPSAPLH